MQRQAPTLGRMLVMVGFVLSCFGLILFVWVSFGGPVPFKPKGYRFQTYFGEATQLAKEADVRISGVPVGRVKDIEPELGRSVVTIELDRRYAPLPSDARAILRQKTLLGETYVELTPGTERAPKIKEGGSLPAGRISPAVELDEIFRSFDDRTRQAFQTWMQSLAQATRGRGLDINDALGNLGPFAQNASRLLDVLAAQQGAVRRLVRNTGEVFAALSERDAQLRSLIESSNLVFSTTGRRDRELREAFVALPTFEDESARTVTRLTRFARATNPLVTQLRPAARELSPTLEDLAGLAPDLQGAFHDLNPLFDASRTGFPALERFLDDLRPVLGALGPFLRNLNPALDFLGLYRRELTGFFANAVAATQATDQPPNARKPIHYLRTTNPVNPENLALYPRRIATNRPNAYSLPGAFDGLRQGLKVFDDRHCGAGGVPVLSSVLSPLLPPALKALIDQLVFTATGPAAVRCVKQGKFTFGGRTTDYPQVHAAAP